MLERRAKLRHAETKGKSTKATTFLEENIPFGHPSGGGLGEPAERPLLSN
jgi:hypothetical protein